jgi:polysaccharide export outer membrane protein
MVGAMRHRRALALLLVAMCLAGLGACTSGQMGEFALVDKQEPKAGSGLTFSPEEKKTKTLRLPTAAESFASAATPGSAAYKIGPQDTLDISVFKVPELARSVQVADSGTINLPLLGEIPAAGKTARELERDLTKRLVVKYLQSPQVTVQVRDYNSQRVTVEGAVRSPGVHVLKGRTTLLQLVAISGGLDQASDSTLVVFRQANGKRYAGRFDIDSIRKGEAEDPPVQAGDVIVANSSAFKAAWGDFMKTLPVASFAMVFF